MIRYVGSKRRKRSRAFNKRERVIEQEEKQHQKEEIKAAKQADIQLQNDIKQVSKDKRKRKDLTATVEDMAYSWRIASVLASVRGF
jgi:hypothetical protein